MKTLFNKQSFFLIAALIFIFGTSCQEKFVEPLDPFDKQRLEKDPAVINFGSGTSALRIKTNKTNIVEFPEGIRIKGSVFTEHERYGDIRLTNGDFVLLKDAAVRKLGKYYYHSDYGNLEISKNRFTRVAGDTLAGYSGMAAYGLFETPAHGILNKVKLPITPHGGMMMFGSGASFKTGADA
ncbi:MAG: hypothetical protein KKD86_20090, partial [Bacteroidetes bacterium]|nr:hypothetical protein [Bacteroidota bacterium]